MDFERYKRKAEATGKPWFVPEGSDAVMNEKAFGALAESDEPDELEVYEKHGGSYDEYLKAAMLRMPAPAQADGGWEDPMCTEPDGSRQPARPGFHRWNMERKDR